MSLDKPIKKKKPTEDKPPKEAKQKSPSLNWPTITKEYLTAAYDIRKNTISGIIEYKPKEGEKYGELNENNLYVEMHEADIKVPKDMLKAILKSSFVDDFNPIVSYFKSLPKWSKAIDADHIKNFCAHVKTSDNELFLNHFKKHLVRCIACVMIPNYFNKQCFVIVSPLQDIGKTSIIRFLVQSTPLAEYSTENVSIDKDGRLSLCENIIINLDELAGMSKYEINQLKAFISYDKVKEREAYAAQKTTRTRIASFFATTNDLNFLNDLTGSSRWICFEVKHIDFEYSKKTNINLLWAQAWALFNSPDFVYNLTKEEKQANEQANQKHTIVSPEQELIQMYYSPSTKDASPETLFLCTTEIVETLNRYSTSKQSVAAIGRTLPKIGFLQHIIKIEGASKRGYYVKFLPDAKPEKIKNNTDEGTPF